MDTHTTLPTQQVQRAWASDGAAHPIRSNQDSLVHNMNLLRSMSDQTKASHAHSLSLTISHGASLGHNRKWAACPSRPSASVAPAISHRRTANSDGKLCDLMHFEHLCKLQYIVIDSCRVPGFMTDCLAQRLPLPSGSEKIFTRP